MLNKLLMTTAVALALAAGVNAQAQTPAPAPAPQTAPSMLPAPATRTQAQATTLGPTEVSVKSMMGVKIYAPKPGTAAANATTRASEAPATTGSTRGMPPTISDADWNAMRENHDNIGDVANIVVNNEGRIHQIVLGVGGFLGIGEKLVAVDWADVHWMRDSNGKLFGIVHRTKQQLEAAPRFVDRT
ncbi:MAG: PRC-barrel domain-containing protein [Rhizobiales bacterium]|nr:PRC-barrel domain-containing protein [Hyphomicrobiales bacterium]